ncbi:hypothetical protein DMN91_000636 [Ooceraea biroi]|uniref:NAD(+) kinase n=1 Tax=Ooceraea biroi TaxID=2015173 RepID=A0A3L8E3P0_OOCBI|nr:hypothetical protein DMN91_000636 [Ooceraea biroi]
MKLLSCLLKTSQWPQRVLGILKLCAFEYFKAGHFDLSNNQLLDQLRKLNKECDEMIAEHRRQLACERNSRGFYVISTIGDASRYVDWADLVIAIGGDGTFLLASRLIRSNKMPIFGINPHSSISDLTLPMEYSSDIDRIFERLRAGDYGLLMRSRIRTTMTGVGLYQQSLHVHRKSRTQDELRIDLETSLKTYAKQMKPLQCTREFYSEENSGRRAASPKSFAMVFMTEILAAKSITFAIQVNDEEELTTRSSGIGFYTGSGSRSWFREMNLLQTETVQTVVAMATGRELSGKETSELLYNMRFPKSLPERRKCRSIRVKSFGFDAGLILDGCVCMPFNDGSTALFEIRPNTR